MRIPFTKVTNQDLNFELKEQNLIFFGKLNKVSAKVVKCSAKMQGKASHYCDRCGCDIDLDIDEDINLSLTDGMYHEKSNELTDVIEFFEKDIDLSYVFISELETYKSDYFYCQNCKNL